MFPSASTEQILAIAAEARRLAYRESAAQVRAMADRERAAGEQRSKEAEDARLSGNPERHRHCATIGSEHLTFAARLDQLASEIEARGTE